MTLDLWLLFAHFLSFLMATCCAWWFQEALFRCEDDRYEIDMVIDNNASAIR